MSSRFRRFLARIAAVARTLRGERYRPEAHYMRGPGPKTRAKAGQLQPKVTR